MSEPQQVHVVLEKKPSNGLGIAGFVVSLVGLVCTLGVLSPVGLLLSLLAVFKPPRGFAIAGVVVGVVGTVLAAVVGVGMWMLWLVGEKAVESLGPEVETVSEILVIDGKVRGAYDSSGDPPSEEKGNALVSEHLDGWGRPFRYVLSPDTRQFLWKVESAGEDGKFGTPDDISRQDSW